MKFDSPLAKTLYEDVVNGYCDDELQEDGDSHYLFLDFDGGDGDPLHVILKEDDEGFVFADVYPSKESAQQAWDELYQEIDDALQFLEDEREPEE